MYKKDFDKLQKLPGYCVFFGSHFYLEEYEKKILSKFEDANVLKMYYDEYDFEGAKKHLSEPTLFGGENILIVKHSKIPPNIEKLADYTKNGYLFFFYYGKKKPGIFGKNFVRFFEPGLKELAEHCIMYEKKYGVRLSTEARSYLIKRCEGLFIEKEIEKLSLYSSEIGVEDVKRLVFEYKEESFEELFYEIINGGDFYDQLGMFLQNNDYKRLLPAFIRFIREHYIYYLYIKKTGSSSLEGLLGYRLPYDVNAKKVKTAVRFKEKEYFELLRFILGQELKMRSSDKDKEAVFWESVSYLKLFFSKHN